MAGLWHCARCGHAFVSQAALQRHRTGDGCLTRLGLVTRGVARDRVALVGHGAISDWSKVLEEEASA